MASDAQRVSVELLDDLAEAAKADRNSALSRLGSTFDGLTWTEARRRLERFGPNELTSQKPPTWPVVLWRALKHPFNGVLGVLAVVSFVTGDFKAGIVRPCDCFGHTASG
jgi:P-type Mg2+ transporter